VSRAYQIATLGFSRQGGRPRDGFALARGLVPILLLLLVYQGQGDAQSQTPGERGPAVGWIRPEEVADRADALLRRLDEVRPNTVAQADLQQIEGGIAVLGPKLDALLERATAALARSASLAQIADVRDELVDTAAPLRGWQEELAAAAKRAADVLDELAQTHRLWSETRDAPETAAAGDVVARRVESSLQAVDEASVRLRAWQARVLAVSDRLVERSTAVEAALEKLRAATVTEGTSLFVRSRAPLWQHSFGAELSSELPRVPEVVLAFNRSTREYAAGDARPLALQALMAAILMFVLRGFSARARERLAGAEEPSRAARLLDHPYAIALLLALLASPALHPLAPRRFMQMIGVITLFPAARVVIHATERANLTAFVGLFVLLFLDRIALALAPLPALASVAFLLALAIALGLVFWFARRIRLAGDAPWLHRAANLAMLSLAIALLAKIGGWTDLAAVVGRGILASALLALYVYAAVIAIEALLAYALASPTLCRSHLVDHNRNLLQRRIERGLRWLGVGLWLILVLRAVGLRNAAADALRSLLQAGVSVGALSLSIGGVLAFVLTLLAALLVARIVNAVLEDEVYPRASLSRGIPYALSTLVRYGVYSLGFLLALAAAGVELSQLAVLLGGLGIGIGLGLQDLVKNFAAGLTLLIERRVHVGDAVQIPSQQIFGPVIAIGMRATVVRNWNGVEVVVPNADLVSGVVANWTLSDRLHRIEVPVGVAYGTDPERVVALLLDVALSSDRLLAEPAPQALFKGFGESSLDFVLRAWTDADYDLRMSELALAVYRSLCEAGINIPFPQRDLHLASVSPDARAALSGHERKE
jgi:potassium efflux system protein